MLIAGGVRYEGGWVNGVRDGVGLLVDPSGDCFEGIWRNNVRQGPGIENLSNLRLAQL